MSIYDVADAQDLDQALARELGDFEPEDDAMVDGQVYRSPPPIRAPRSSMAAARPAPRLSTVAKPPDSSARKSVSSPVQFAPHSPTNIRKGRPSGLPPPSGPDYTQQRATSSSSHKRPLKPFSSNKLQHRGVAAGQVKRSRVSTGAMSSASGMDLDGREAKRRRAHSDD